MTAVTTTIAGGGGGSSGSSAFFRSPPPPRSKDNPRRRHRASSRFIVIAFVASGAAWLLITLYVVYVLNGLGESVRRGVVEEALDRFDRAVSEEKKILIDAEEMMLKAERMVVAGAAEAAGGILDRLGRFGGSGGGGGGVGGGEKKGAAVSAADDPFDFSALEEYLLANGPEALRRPLAAFIERPLNDTVPDSRTYGEASVKGQVGTPPIAYVPLPRRTGGPSDLLRFEYERFGTCHDVPSRLPAGRIFNDGGRPNINNREPIHGNSAIEEAAYCPVHADPFLPWLHDVFPSSDGSAIVLIAQNMRRCNTGNRFLAEIRDLEPQVVIIQPVRMRRLELGGVQASDLARICGVWRGGVVMETATETGWAHGTAWPRTRIPTRTVL